MQPSPSRRLAMALVGAVLLLGACQKKAAPAEGGLVAFRIGGTAVINPDLPPKTELQPGGVLGYAIHRGTFQAELKKAGFDYAGFSGYPRTAAALLGLSSGQVQVASTGDSPAVLSRARGDKQRAIWIGAPTGDIWVVGRKGGPTSLKALAGGKVGVLFGSTAHYIFRSAAEAEGVKGVEFAQLQPAQALAALQRGDVDGYAAATATTAELWRLRYGLPVIARIGKDHPELQGISVMTVREDFLAAHPSFPAAFWRGLKTGIDAIKADPETYYRWTSEQTGTPIEIVRATAVERYADVPFPKAGVDGLQKLLAFQRRTGLANSDFQVADWATGPVDLQP